MNLPHLSYTSSREAEIRNLLDTSGRSLEIGPSYNPILPKSLGYNTVTVDHTDASELRRKYSSHQGVDVSKIEEVDYVWRGEPLATLIGAGRFDLVVASHVIEHTPDMLGFLKECEKLLKPHGKLLLAVPDRRRCFDLFRPASTTGAVLQAHLEKRTRHSAGTAFDFIASFAVLDTTMGDRPPAAFSLPHSANEAKNLFDRASRAEEYIDIHAWVFTPSSFRLILSDLNTIDALTLKEDTLWGTPIFEFVTVLSRQGRGCHLSRADLLVACQAEAALHHPPRPENAQVSR
jgi:SAM-dependent methyltransferase